MSLKRESSMIYENDQYLIKHFLIQLHMSSRKMITAKSIKFGKKPLKWFPNEISGKAFDES